MPRNDMAEAAGKLTNFAEPLKIYKNSHNYKEELMNYSPQMQSHKARSALGQVPSDYSEHSYRPLAGHAGMPSIPPSNY